MAHYRTFADELNQMPENARSSMIESNGRCSNEYEAPTRSTRGRQSDQRSSGDPRARLGTFDYKGRGMRVSAGSNDTPCMARPGPSFENNRGNMDPNMQWEYVEQGPGRQEYNYSGNLSASPGDSAEEEYCRAQEQGRRNNLRYGYPSNAMPEQYEYCEYQNNQPVNVSAPAEVGRQYYNYSGRPLNMSDLRNENDVMVYDSSGRALDPDEFTQSRVKASRKSNFRQCPSNAVPEEYRYGGRTLHLSDFEPKSLPAQYSTPNAQYRQMSVDESYGPARMLDSSSDNLNVNGQGANGGCRYSVSYYHIPSIQNQNSSRRNEMQSLPPNFSPMQPSRIGSSPIIMRSNITNGQKTQSSGFDNSQRSTSISCPPCPVHNLFSTSTFSQDLPSSGVNSSYHSPCEEFQTDYSKCALASDSLHLRNLVYEMYGNCECNRNPMCLCGNDVQSQLNGDKGLVSMLEAFDKRLKYEKEIQEDLQRRGYLCSETSDKEKEQNNYNTYRDDLNKTSSIDPDLLSKVSDFGNSPYIEAIKSLLKAEKLNENDKIAEIAEEPVNDEEEEGETEKPTSDFTIEFTKNETKKVNGYECLDVLSYFGTTKPASG